MSLNPVERRLALLNQDWLKFRADASRRVLIWQLPANAVRIAEAWIEAQKYEHPDYTTGDLLLLFKTPFVHGLRYARELKEALRGQYDASLEDLKEQGLTTDWPFQPETVPDTPAGFGDAVRSFGSHYHRSIGHLVVVFMPASVAHQASWEAWVEALLVTELPERLRVLLIDTVEQPRYTALVERIGKLALVQAPALDSFAVAEECFAQEGIGPAATFRTLMMGVVTLLEKGSAEQVRARVVEALAFAQKQGWQDQQVALKLMMAGAFVKEARYPEALQTYERARQDAGQTLKAGHPAAHKLILQTWFGQAGMHLVAGQFPEAARCYDQAAAVAQADKNALLGIEARRMSAQMHAKAGDPIAGAERAVAALKLTAQLLPEARGMTTAGTTIAEQLALLDPKRFTAMRRVKNVLADELETVRQQGDILATQLTAARAPDALDQVETLREAGAAAAATRAETALQTLVAGGDTVFQEWVAQGDGLLGAGWLVRDDLALPPLPPEEFTAAEEAAPEGAPA